MRTTFSRVTAIALLVLSFGVLAGCSSQTSNTEQTETTQEQTTPEVAEKSDLPTVDKLKVEDLKKGKGPKAETGNKLSVVYKGTLTDNTPFDSNTADAPFEFTLGTGEVIEGWDQGLQGVQAGGKRKLTIPADLAYGDMDNGNIPAGSTLIFEVEVLSITQ